MCWHSLLCSPNTLTSMHFSRRQSGNVFNKAKSYQLVEDARGNFRQLILKWLKLHLFILGVDLTWNILKSGGLFFFILYSNFLKSYYSNIEGMWITNITCLSFFFFYLTVIRFTIALLALLNSKSLCYITSSVCDNVCVTIQHVATQSETKQHVYKLLPEAEKKFKTQT